MPGGGIPPSFLPVLWKNHDRLLQLWYDKKINKGVNEMHWERTVRRQVRRSTDIIGVTILASLAINYLLYPLMWLLPDFAEGTVGRELTDAALYVIVFAIPFAVGTRLSGMTVQELVGDKRPAPEIYLMTSSAIQSTQGRGGLSAHQRSAHSLPKASSCRAYSALFLLPKAPLLF